MTDDVAGQVIKAEQDRIQSLLDVDRGTYDRLHAAEYRLCNPTGTVWTKAEYLDLLTTGRVVYRELGLIGDVNAIVGTDVVVLRYRCAIELTVDGADIPRHVALRLVASHRHHGPSVVTCRCAGPAACPEVLLAA